MRVIADPTLHPRRLVLLDVAFRVLLAAITAVLIFWILPVIADAAA